MGKGKPIQRAPHYASKFGPRVIRGFWTFRGKIAQGRLKIYEQLHFYSNKAKTGLRHFSLKHYKTRYTPVKRDRIKKKQGMVSVHNEIRMRYERDTNLHNLWPFRDKTEDSCYWSARCAEKKTSKNEIHASETRLA